MPRPAAGGKYKGFAGRCRRSGKRNAARALAPQRRSMCSTSSSSMRTWRTICELSADSSFCASPSRRRRAPPMV